jgi:hypothetical protein
VVRLVKLRGQYHTSPLIMIMASMKAFSLVLVLVLVLVLELHILTWRHFESSVLIINVGEEGPHVFFCI